MGLPLPLIVEGEQYAGHPAGVGFGEIDLQLGEAVEGTRSDELRDRHIGPRVWPARISSSGRKDRPPDVVRFKSMAGAIRCPTVKSGEIGMLS